MLEPPPAEIESTIAIRSDRHSLYANRFAITTQRCSALSLSAATCGVANCDTRPGCHHSTHLPSRSWLSSSASVTPNRCPNSPRLSTYLHHCDAKFRLPQLPIGLADQPAVASSRSETPGRVLTKSNFLLAWFQSHKSLPPSLAINASLFTPFSI